MGHLRFSLFPTLPLCNHLFKAKKILVNSAPANVTHFGPHPPSGTEARGPKFSHSSPPPPPGPGGSPLSNWQGPRQNRDGERLRGGDMLTTWPHFIPPPPFPFPFRKAPARGGRSRNGRGAGRRRGPRSSYNTYYLHLAGMAVFPPQRGGRRQGVQPRPNGLTIPEC